MKRGAFDYLLKPLRMDALKLCLERAGSSIRLGIPYGSPAPVCPDLGQVNHKGTDFFYHHEPEMGDRKSVV